MAGHIGKLASVIRRVGGLEVKLPIGVDRKSVIRRVGGLEVKKEKPRFMRGFLISSSTHPAVPPDKSYSVRSLPPFRSAPAQPRSFSRSLSASTATARHFAARQN